MKRNILSIILLGVVGTLCFTQEINFSGELSSMWGMAAPWTANAGDFVVGATDFTGSLEVYQGKGTLYIEGNANYNALNNQLDFDLGEAYIDYADSNWGFRIGNQKVVWGKADGINITNSVFPEDSTSLFTDDSSLSVTAAKFSFSGDFFNIDVLWIPFFRGTDLPLEEGSPLRNAMIPSQVAIPGVGTIPVKIGTLQTPELALKNCEYGLKFSGYFSLCDVSLYGFYGWDKMPLMNYSLVFSNPPIPDAIKIDGEYSRLAMFGLDAAFPIGATVLCLEGAYFQNRKMQASAETILGGGEIGIEQHQIMALAGLDWMPSGWTITAQYYCDAVLNKSDNLERKDAFNHGATLSISKSFLQDTLELSLSGLVGLNDFDSAFTLDGKYSLSDQIKLSAGTYVFLPGPDGDGTYGKLKDLSTIYIKAQYSF
ncbi:MAG: hypothetical protein MJ174_08320 [Treponema sp.]|nr:hypothetical protein [Treponema sp.]